MWVRKTAEIARRGAVEITVDGLTVRAYPGESVATALFAAGMLAFRHSPRLGLPRAAFCMMGSCQECVVRVDGRVRPACQAQVTAGMRVQTGSPPDA